jgi:hypothetical protein
MYVCVYVSDTHTHTHTHTHAHTQGDELAYSDTFRLRMRAALIAAAGGLAGVFSSACFKHTLSLSADFWLANVATQDGRSVSFRDALAAWMDGGGTPGAKAVVVMADCVGFDCGCPNPSAAWGSVI